MEENDEKEKMMKKEFPTEPLTFIAQKENERIKKGIHNIIDSCVLPFWMVEGIFKEILIEIKEKAESEKMWDTMKYVEDIRKFCEGEFNKGEEEGVNSGADEINDANQH